MKQDDIIRMAREAGFEIGSLTNAIYAPTSCETELERFAALVAAAEREVRSVRWDEYIAKAIAAEREACAKLCDEIAIDMWKLYKGRPPYKGDEEGRASDFTQGRSAGAEDCAEAIRKRSST